MAKQNQLQTFNNKTVCYFIDEKTSDISNKKYLPFSEVARNILYIRKM